MDDLIWGRNMTFPWNNDHHHHQPQEIEEIEEIFDFDSENLFMNPIQQLHRTDSSASHQIVHQQLDALNAISTFNNGFQEIENSISISTTATATATSGPEQPEYIPFASNSNNDDDISAIFSDCKNFVRNNNNTSDASSGNSVSGGGGATQFRFSEENAVKSKRSGSETGQPGSSNISFRQPSGSPETDSEAIAQMKEMMYRAAAFRPVSFSPAAAEKPRRRNVRVSSDPQTTAARRRRERISERIRVLQRLVPGGNKMDTASMLDEAANYLKFLRSQVKALEQWGTTVTANGTSPVIPYTYPFPMQPYFPLPHQTYCRPYPTQ